MKMRFSKRKSHISLITSVSVEKSSFLNYVEAIYFRSEYDLLDHKTIVHGAVVDHNTVERRIENHRIV